MDCNKALDSSKIPKSTIKTITFGIRASVRERIFFLVIRFFDLAPKKKPTKFQLEMTTSIDDLKKTMDTMAAQLVGIHNMASQFAGS
jgi:hypothetical protein